MTLLFRLLGIILVIVSTASAAPGALPKMRPYAGIGVLHLPVSNSVPAETTPLYEEPALSRLGEFNRSKTPSYDWIFGATPAAQLLIVTARKGSWLRVVYDDAGREAWLKPTRQMTFQTWELFLKGNLSHLLPGLHKKYYQLFQEPGDATAASVTIHQPFKVLQLENEWAMVLIDQISLGWLRWLDDDGRLIIGIVTESKVPQL